MKKIILVIIGFTAISFSLTEEGTMIKDKDEFVPQWAKKVVWYQIFPERLHLVLASRSMFQLIPSQAHAYHQSELLQMQPRV